MRRPENKSSHFDAVVIGVSTGGLHALSQVLPRLPADFPAAVLVVQHLIADAGDYLWKSLAEKSAIRVKQAEEKEEPRPATAYIAPPNYHLQVEPDRTLSLSVDERVCFARPSIDVLFQTAAEAYRDRLIAVILTGANSDGSDGVVAVRELGGVVIAQDPATAEASFMPEAAMRRVVMDHVVRLDALPELLTRLCREGRQ